MYSNESVFRDLLHAVDETRGMYTLRIIKILNEQNYFTVDRFFPLNIFNIIPFNNDPEKRSVYNDILFSVLLVLNGVDSTGKINIKQILSCLPVEDEIFMKFKTIDNVLIDSPIIINYITIREVRDQVTLGIRYDNIIWTNIVDNKGWANPCTRIIKEYNNKVVILSQIDISQAVVDFMEETINKYKDILPFESFKKSAMTICGNAYPKLLKQIEDRKNEFVPPNKAKTPPPSFGAKSFMLYPGVELSEMKKAFTKISRTNTPSNDPFGSVEEEKGDVTGEKEEQITSFARSTSSDEMQQQQGPSDGMEEEKAELVVESTPKIGGKALNPDLYVRSAKEITMNMIKSNLNKDEYVKLYTANQQPVKGSDVKGYINNYQYSPNDINTFAHDIILLKEQQFKAKISKSVIIKGDNTIEFKRKKIEEIVKDIFKEIVVELMYGKFFSSLIDSKNKLKDYSTANALIIELLYYKFEDKQYNTIEGYANIGQYKVSGKHDYIRPEGHRSYDDFSIPSNYYKKNPPQTIINILSGEFGIRI